ncbi:DUF3068 domain-containing protein [Corynebacterium guangdongense]|uniref:DUF3068 domain-containing protein n=1 Tax=Corynebacterium guangdongense TaxID=1783348 RepID=A0ABU1ZU74_9CORY|nr:DUF3068 domain-containing protein [Corynebacterium guangdongense]MDR7328486.1 hypothetical protein [Corynebacterium guangdongense]WJZ17063.1 hypothetical protein CGUA_02335 [Corynebacterium guangdongense]
MLPKSRIFSATLVGLGVALVAGGAAAPAFLNYDGRLPLDLGNTTWTLRDDSASTRLITDGRVLEVPVTRQLHLDVQQPATQDVAGVRIGSTWMRDSFQDEQERLIEASTWSYTMDRVSGQAQTPATLAHTIGMPPEEVDVDGVWLKFPSDAEQTTYDVFDETLRQARPATYIDSQEREGRTIHHYRQVIEPTNVAELHDGLFVAGEIDGRPAPLFHSVTRDLYVDQISGVVIDAEVAVDDYYAFTAEGPERQTVLTFEGERDEAQVAAALAEVKDIHGQATARLIQWAVIGVGVLLALAGLIGAFATGARTRRRPPGGGDAGSGQ